MKYKPGLLTVEQVAEILDLSPRHVRDVVKSQIGYVKPNKKIFFYPEKVDEYIRSKQIEAVKT